MQDRHGDKGAVVLEVETVEAYVNFVVLHVDDRSLRGDESQVVALGRERRDFHHERLGRTVVPELAEGHLLEPWFAQGVDAGDAVHGNDVADGWWRNADDADVDDARRIFKQESGLFMGRLVEDSVDASCYDKRSFRIGVAVTLVVRDF